MTRFLVIANDFIGARMAGPGIRAWEIACALHDYGVDVVLAAPGKSLPAAPFTTVLFDSRGDTLRAAAERVDGLLVQGATLTHFPFLAAMDKPIAVDIYDPFVLENLQARMHELPSGRWRQHEGDMALLLGQLERGDFFLCASENQWDFWLGMLTAVGRVNPSTYDGDPSLRQLLDVMPFGLPDQPPVATRPVLKGVVPGIGPDDYVILWGGGIWNWFDPLTLIRAVGQVAERRPHVRLFFMGTAVPPSQFKPSQAMAAQAHQLARELGLMGRVVFFNERWAPYADRANYLLEADLGASTHLPHLETRFSFRTRLLDCFWSGLPMVVTGGDVLAGLVQAHQLGRVVPPEDVAAVAAAIEAVMDAPGGRAAYAPGFAAVRATLTWPRAVAPLAAFARAPRRSPDRPAGPGAMREPTTTPLRQLPLRAVEVLRQGGPLLLLEESARYLRWLRRPRG
jgi:glycosyltransferase involved in cell wall biosynthesis